MRLFDVTRFLALVISIAFCFSTNAAGADYPRLLWSISDDELTAALGAVIDVAVDTDGTVYLLDAQVNNVRRITVDGRELPPLGRKGEGPGEFDLPTVIAAIPNGGVIVVQEFHRPAVGLLADGRAADAPDLNVIRERFGMTSFGAARYDATGRLIVTAVTTERKYDPMRPTQDLGNGLSVFAIKRGDRQPTVLFTNSESLGDKNTVRFWKDRNNFYALRSWDIDATGRVVYADPDGKYTVQIGHPADGPSTRVPLAPAPGDEEALSKLAKSARVPLERYYRIVDVRWIASDRFLIKPTAAMPTKELRQDGTVEFFNLQGTSLGRRVIPSNYDRDADSFFIRGSTLVIIRSGKLTIDAWLTVKPKPGPQQAEDEEIVVEAYDLTPQ